jgi:hypothetical protein
MPKAYTGIQPIVGYEKPSLEINRRIDPDTINTPYWPEHPLLEVATFAGAALIVTGAAVHIARKLAGEYE